MHGMVFLGKTSVTLHTVAQILWHLSRQPHWQNLNWGFHDLHCLVIFIREIFAIATVQEHSATGTLPLGLQADLEYILFLPNLGTLDGVI